MRAWRTCVLIVVCAVACVAAQSSDPATLPRVQASDLHYLGSFALPQTDSSGDLAGRLTYGGWALGLSPEGGLYLAGHDQTSPARLFEVSIPAIGGTATIRQRGADPTQGRQASIDPDNKIRMAGSLAYDGRLITAYYSYYDGDESATLSHVASGLTLGADPVVGPVRVGTTGAGFVGGYMAAIPAEWRAALGGPAVTGVCCLAIANRTSWGPALSVFDPADIGRVDGPVPATEVLGYPMAHPTLGEWRSGSTRYNGTTEIAGMAFPAGTRSVLFIGKQGTGPFCYGTGETCSDPVAFDQGVHGYPYVHQVWAYDVNDLVKVKAGELEPWQVEPYATWRLTEMNDAGNASIRGAVYDAATRRLYVTTAYGENPRVHVYELAIGATVEPEPPVDEPDPPVEEPPVDEPGDPEPPADEPTVRALLEAILARLTPSGTPATCEIVHEPTSYSNGDPQIVLRCPAGTVQPMKGARVTVSLDLH